MSEKLSRVEFISQSLFWSIVRDKCQSAQTTAWSRGHFPANSCDVPMPGIPRLSLSRCHSWPGACVWVCLERSDKEKAQEGQTQHFKKCQESGVQGRAERKLGTPRLKPAGKCGLEQGDSFLPSWASPLRATVAQEVAGTLGSEICAFFGPNVSPVCQSSSLETQTRRDAFLSSCSQGRQARPGENCFQTWKVPPSLSPRTVHLEGAD